MMSKIVTKVVKKSPYIVGVIAMAFLASCSSSNQLASSFSKRKYTKGHFSDPVASVKTTSNNTGYADVEISSVKNTKAENNVAKNSGPAVAIVSEPVVAEVNKTQINRVESKKNHTVSASASPIAAPTKPVTPVSMASPAAPENITSYHHGSEGGGGGGHHYLSYALLYFLLGLLFYLIAAVALTGGGAGVFLFAFCGWICFILCIVYLILWLIHLGD